ncbi:MAG TPA: hypothetical protein VF899_17950, partial [Pyrinomonadaceae bacterium]
MRRSIKFSVVILFSAVILAGGVLAQNSILVPADNLVTDGITPIPASLVEDVRRYTEFRAAGLSSWHPTRREMLISTRFGDTNQIHLV